MRIPRTAQPADAFPGAGTLGRPQQYQVVDQERHGRRAQHGLGRLILGVLKPDRLKLGPAFQDNDIVFASPLGTAQDARNVSRLFTRLLTKNHLREIRFHDLRHTAATLLLSAGVNPKVVSERLGHATISITLDVYSHVMPDMQRDTASLMEKLIRTAGD